MKYKLLKAIDLIGLNFLSPVVRLCYGEEPQVQLKKIGQLIVIPILAILFFIMCWFILADQVKTKSGKLPDPSQTMVAAGAIWQFHVREGEKEEAYTLTGSSRENLLAEAENKLAAIDEKEKAAKEAAKVAEEKGQKASADRVAPFQESLDKKTAEVKKAQKERTDALEVEAKNLTPNDAQAYQAYLDKFRAHTKQTETEKDLLKDIRSDIKTMLDEKDKGLVEAQYALTLIAEERQYLGKLKDMLTKANKENKLQKLGDKLEEDKAAFAVAEGDKVFTLAKRVTSGEGRIAKMEESEYAKPASLVYQTKRSLLCVFFGFMVATIIAIPIGILCGLSSTFMAAVTPFIALFKPVSPIVWLPIALIIVSAQIPDPDTHWLTQFLWDLPWLGQYKINPAFIASGITVALCSLWPTLVNTALGVASVDKDHNNVARVLKLGFWSRLFKIVIPSALPLIFAGLRISLGVGWMVLIAAELLASSEGIGKFVWDQFNNGASDSFAKMVVVVFVVGFFGLLLDRIMIVLQKLVTFDESPSAA